VIAGTYAWRDGTTGQAMGVGGFPLQAGALSKEFAALTVVAPDVGPLEGGIGMPAPIELVGVREPAGTGLVRKAALIVTLPRYLGPIARTVRRHTLGRRA
jgi:hypothetical protein